MVAKHFLLTTTTAVGIACSSRKFHIFHVGLMMFEKNWAAAQQGQAD